MVMGILGNGNVYARRSIVKLPHEFLHEYMSSDMSS
jgi:hypothetical protein